MIYDERIKEEEEEESAVVDGHCPSG